jgi:hypothetical protein
MPANQNNIFTKGKFPGNFLGKNTALGGKQNYRLFGVLYIRFAQEIFNCFNYRLRFQHHSGPSAVRIIIHNLMAVKSVITEVVYINRDQLLVNRSLYDAACEGPFEHFRKQCQYINPHVIFPLFISDDFITALLYITKESEILRNFRKKPLTRDMSSSVKWDAVGRSGKKVWLRGRSVFWRI